MKIITVQKIGYNHPSQANWSYEIYSMGLVDTKNEYNMSYTLKGAFTSDSQFTREIAEKLKINRNVFKMLKAVYPGKTQNITGVSNMLNTGSKELLDIIKEFLTKK